MRRTSLISLCLVLSAPAAAAGPRQVLRIDHAEAAYSGIERAQALAIARTAAAARAAAVDGFGLDMPQTVKVHVTCEPGRPVRLFNDGQDRFFLSVRSPADLRRPAASGIFHIYGLCHEAAHLAMYRPIRDHSWMTTAAAEGWAHYLGSRLVDAVHARLGGDLWPDKYDYRADGVKRLDAQLAATEQRPIVKGAGLWKELVAIVGDKGVAPIFAGWGKAKVDAADPAPALRKALLATSARERLAGWWAKAEPVFVVKRPRSAIAARTARPSQLMGKPRELAHDDGAYAGRRSIAGSGHAVKFQAGGDSWYLTAVRVHGARYGRLPRNRNFNLWLCDADFKAIADFTFPYSKFPFGRRGWMRLPVRPTEVPREFIVCVGFNPTATMGVFVSHDKEGSGQSLTGLPGRGGREFAKGDWLIRAEVDQLKSADPLRPAADPTSKVSPAPKAAGQRPAAVVVHANDFEKEVGPEWSSQKTDVTPKGQRKFLGQFGNDKVTLTLKDLAAHKYLRVSFDMYVIGTWDGTLGAGGSVGPDIWSVNVEDGPELIRCTFANGVLPGCTQQSFPDNYPGPAHGRQAGADEVATLGYQTNHPKEGDAVYRLNFAFAHTAAHVSLTFAASGLEDLANESWGLDNLEVELLTGPQPMAAEELERHWQALFGDDALKAFKASWTLVTAGDGPAELAISRFRPAKLDAAQVHRLVQDLDAHRWSDREQAHQRLLAAGRAVLPLLRQAQKADVSAEAWTRLQQLMDRLEKPALAVEERARWERIIRMLEVTATNKAVEALGLLWRHGRGDEVRHLAGAAADRVAQPRIDALLERARAHRRKLEFDAAKAACREALGLARAVGMTAEKAITARLARLDKLAKLHEEAPVLAARLKDRPDDRALREKLIRTWLVELDRPDHAAKYLDLDCDARWRRNIPLAAADPEKLTPAECHRLALWYHQLAREDGKLRGPMLERSRSYYALYVERLRRSAEEAEREASEIRADLAKTAERAWIDLLRTVRPQTHSHAGQWTLEAGALRVSPGERARLYLPVAPEGDYEFAAEFVRKSGSGDVNVILPVGRRGVMLCLDDLEGDSWLQNVDGKDLAIAKAPALLVGQPQQLAVTVHQRRDHAQIVVILNDRELLRWRGPTALLSVRPSWALPRGEALAVGVHRSDVAFTALRLHMLSGRAKRLRFPPEAPSAPQRIRFKPGRQPILR